MIPLFRDRVFQWALFKNAALSDTFYRTIRFFGRFPLWVSSRPIVRGVENLPRSGPFLLATTHQSPFDVPLMIRHVPRLLDIVSITEVFRHPFLGWFYGNLNAFPLERSRADPAAVRTLLDRLARGRAVAMFPEGRLRAGQESVLHNGAIRPGIGRIAALSGVPVVPCVILRSGSFATARAWLPLRSTRYAIGFAAPFTQPMDAGELEAALVDSFRAVADSLESALSQGAVSGDVSR